MSHIVDVNRLAAMNRRKREEEKHEHKKNEELRIVNLGIQNFKQRMLETFQGVVDMDIYKSSLQANKEENNQNINKDNRINFEDEGDY